MSETIEIIEKNEPNTMNEFKDDVLKNFSGFAYIICRNKMIYGIIENGKITDHADKEVTDWQTYLIEARFYNKEREIKVFNRMGKLYYRDRNSHSSLAKSDTQQILLGTTFSECGKFVKATEDRGTIIYIPKDAFEPNTTLNINTMNTEKKRIALQIAQYINYENNLATIVDYRFINYKII